MIEFWRREENIPLIVAGAVVAVVILALLSPEEQTLGSMLRLVFVHAALMWVSFFMYTLAAVLSLLYLVGGKQSHFLWGESSVRTAMLILLVTGLLGLITAKITWGGIIWQEPRMAMLAKMLLASAFAFILSFVISKKIIAVVNVLLGATIWWLLLGTQKIIHPNSPIFTSNSTAIKVFSLLIAFVLGIMALQIARGLSRYSQR